ncbi:MAG: class I SAM-dependent methyltransferase [Candidatus Heimdallarchaeota archaeon]
MSEASKEVTLGSSSKNLAKTFFIEIKKILTHFRKAGQTFMNSAYGRTELGISKAKILDIGAGAGAFLQKMSEQGLECYGVDVNPNLADQAKKGGWLYHLGDLEEDTFSEQFFDVITINHTLEHMHHPDRILHLCHKYLKDDGQLVVGIPNADSLIRTMFKENWVYWEVPRHLYHFNPRNFKRLLNTHNFRVTAERFNSMPHQFTGSLQYLLDKRTKIPYSPKKMRTSAFDRFPAFARNPFLNLLFLPITLLFNRLALSDSFEVVSRKMLK